MPSLSCVILILSPRLISIGRAPMISLACALTPWMLLKVKAFLYDGWGVGAVLDAASTRCAEASVMKLVDITTDVEMKLPISPIFFVSLSAESRSFLCANFVIASIDSRLVLSRACMQSVF